MRKVNICFMLVGLIQFTALAADCNNPLTSADNWDEDLLEDRPRYLSEPVALTDGLELGICAGLLGECDQTCCDANTILDIEQVVEKYLEHLEKVAERKVGPILDTIADFHPDTQEEVGYEYDMDGEQEGVVTGELAGATRGKRGLQSQQGGQQQGGQGQVGQQQGGQQGGQGQGGQGQGGQGQGGQGQGGQQQGGQQGGQQQGGQQGGQQQGGQQQGGQGQGGQGQGGQGQGGQGQGGQGQDGQGQDGQGQGGQGQGGQGQDGQGQGGQGQGGQGQGGQGQGHVDPTNKPKPPKKPEDLSEEELQQQYQAQQEEMGDRYRPKNRGKRRWRPGLVNLTDDQKEQVRVLVEDMVAYLETYSAEMASCLDSQLKQMAGLLCMGCNACYADYISEDAVEETVTVTLSQESCDAMAENCSSYMEAVKELRNKFKEFKDSLKEIVQQAVDNGDIQEEHVHPEDLDETVEDKPPKCEGDDCKDFYCKEAFEANGGLAPSEEMADPVESRRRMQSYSVSYDFVEGEGYNPQKVEVNYTTAVDNFSAEDLAGSDDLEDDIEDGVEDSVEDSVEDDGEDDSAYTLALGLVGVILSLV